jgi:hypothetical protein
MWIQFNTNEKRLEDRMITEQTLELLRGLTPALRTLIPSATVI